MFEFDTVSASSYDPSALASKLTQKSAEGWEVVSIVPTGGDVTAFVRRAAGSAAPAAVEAPVAETPADTAPMWSDTTTYTPEPAATYTPEPAAPAAEEPSGWGAAPEATTTWGSDTATYTPEPAATYTPEPAATYTPEPAATYTPEPAATYTPEPAATYTPEPAATYTPEPTPEPVAEAAPAYDPTPTQQVPSVPAGWYADPAGRFELRYWDGGQWTEHVARGGAQYTDPPVA